MGKKMGYLTASAYYCVPRMSLYRKCEALENNRLTVNLGHNNIGWKIILSPHLEQLLEKYVLELQKRYFGIIQNDLRVMAYELAMKNGNVKLFGKEYIRRCILFILLFIICIWLWRRKAHPVHHGFWIGSWSMLRSCWDPWQVYLWIMRWRWQYNFIMYSSQIMNHFTVLMNAYWFSYLNL